MFCRCTEVTALVGVEGMEYAREHLTKQTYLLGGKWVTAYVCPLFSVTWVSDVIPGPVPDGPRYRLRRLPTLGA